MAEADAWAKLVLARLRAARMAVPSAEILRPELEAAARAGAQAAQARKTPARARLESTGSGLRLRFVGPGAHHAHAVAEHHLARTLPYGMERMRRQVAKQLKGNR